MIKQTAYSALLELLCRTGAVPDVEALMKFISAASGQENDAVAHRCDEVFRLIREVHSFNDIYKDAKLKEFLISSMDWNPFIPEEFIRATKRSAAFKGPDNRFVEDWISNQPAETVRGQTIDVADFGQFLSIHPPMFENFAKMNVHGPSYFFSKSAEWYLSYLACRVHGYRRILDIGAASTWFASILDRVFGDLDICLVDLGFPPGLRRLSPRIAQLGADAGNLNSFPDNSVDMICMHNAFEHFSGDSDWRCIREAARILKPGGRVLITPLFTASRFTMAFNPLSAFYFRDFGDTSKMVNMVRDALRSGRADVTSTLAMASPYMHSYDYQSVVDRVLTPAIGLQPTLLKVSFSGGGTGSNRSIGAYGLTFDPTAFDRTPMLSLELRKAD